MTVAKVARILTAGILIAVGIFWSVMFPKTTDILRPDFVASVAIGAGLIVSGFIILFLKKGRILTAILVVLLIWSVFLNLFMLSSVKRAVKAIRNMP